MSATQTKTIRMRTPDGQEWDVPEDKVSAAEGRGATRIQELAPKKETTIMGRIGEFAEDIGFPGMGAFAGGVAGLPLGPLGVAGGAGLGAMAGSAGKNIIRSLQGRGATPEEVSTDIGISGAAGPFQELGPATRGMGRTLQTIKSTPQSEAAQKMGVDITKGQAGSHFLATVEDFLSKTLGGSQFFKGLGQKQAKQLDEGIEKFTSQISRSKLSKEDAGTLLQEMVKKMRARAGENVGKAVQQIGKELPDLKVPQKGVLASEAKGLLGELEGATAQHTELRKFADIDQAIKILRQFSAEGVEIPIKDAIKLRSILFKIGDVEGISTLGKSNIKRLNHALDESIGNAVKGAGREDLFTLFRTASDEFRTVADKVDSKVIQQLLKENNEDLIVDILLRRGASGRIDRIVSIVGEKNFRPVARAAMERIFNEATEEGILISQKFANIRKRIGDKAINKLLGSEQAAKEFADIAQLIDSLGLTRQLTTPRGASGGMGLLLGGSAAAGASLLAGSPEAAGASVLFTSGIVGLPALLARYMTGPKGMATLKQTIEEGMRVGGKREATVRLISLLTAQQAKERTLKRTEAAIEQDEEEKRSLRLIP